MLKSTEKTITQKLDEAFDLKCLLIDEEIENAIDRHIQLDKEHLKKVHSRIISILKLSSQNDSKYFVYENFELLFLHKKAVVKLKNMSMPDLSNDLMFI
jgi:hypothetical protein